MDNNQKKTLAVVMGGGAGSRLFPLTKDRSKPAVPLGGKYRLVDIPISNCINSGIRNVYVLTQYNSASLNRHLNVAYKFDSFGSGFVDILAAAMTRDDEQWYQGTADAVRQNFPHLMDGNFDYFLILSGDQLYRMDFREIIAHHRKTKADLTVAALPVSRKDAKTFGVMKTDAQGAITDFLEKPSDDKVLDDLTMPQEIRDKFKVETDEERFQASMGIYVFSRKALIDALDNEDKDFGKHIIPRAIKEQKVQSYVFQGYWEDIGTIRSFFDANLDLCATIPEYDFFDAVNPIFTNARFLPASKINGATIKQSIISDGCILTDAYIENSVVGLRSVIESRSFLRNVVAMGGDYFSDEFPDHSSGIPVGVGADCRIEDTIIDKNARIGNGCVISPHNKPAEFDSPDGMYYIRDNIVVIPKNAVIPPGTTI